MRSEVYHHDNFKQKTSFKKIPAKIQKSESVEKQKKIKLTDVLKSRTNINLLIEQILDQQIELSVHNLIKASSSLYKVLFSSVKQFSILKAHDFNDK